MEFHHLNYIVISQKTDMSGTVTSRENVYQFPEYLGYPKTIKRDDVGIVPYNAVRRKPPNPTKKGRNEINRFCLLYLSLTVHFITLRFFCDLFYLRLANVNIFIIINVTGTPMIAANAYAKMLGADGNIRV